MGPVSEPVRRGRYGRALTVDVVLGAGCCSTCSPRWRRARPDHRTDAGRAAGGPDCQTRYVGQQRCPDCNAFCTRLGLGGRLAAETYSAVADLDACPGSAAIAACGSRTSIPGPLCPTRTANHLHDLPAVRRFRTPVALHSRSRSTLTSGPHQVDRRREPGPAHKRAITGRSWWRA